MTVVYSSLPKSIEPRGRLGSGPGPKTRRSALMFPDARALPLEAQVLARLSADAKVDPERDMLGLDLSRERIRVIDYKTAG